MDPYLFTVLFSYFQHATCYFRLGLQWNLSSERTSAIVQEFRCSKPFTNSHSRYSLLWNMRPPKCCFSGQNCIPMVFFFFVNLCIYSHFISSPKHNIPSWTISSLKIKALRCVESPGFLYLVTQRYIMKMKSSATPLRKYQTCFMYCIIHSTILYEGTVQQRIVRGRYGTWH